MSDASKTLKGPDLAKDGASLDEIRDGAMLLGHANGEAVLLARQGDEIFAVGAKCTHYNGPLDKGLLVGHTVRCPWHHAAFDLRDGEAERAPALNPLACWSIERRDGRVYVTHKHKRDPLQPAPERRIRAPQGRPTQARPGPDGHPSSIVIVGAGAAGSAAAEMLRRSGFAGPITMIDPDGDAPYDRPNASKDFLAGQASADWMPLRPSGFYARHDIRRLNTSVAAIDAQRREVRLADGASLPYGALLLATGAEPRRLDIPGHDRNTVCVLRTQADSQAIIDKLGDARRVAVIGASFIGLEVAASLRARDIEVHVIAPDARPLAKVLGDALGARVQDLHQQHGVTFHLKQAVERIEDAAVVLKDGTRIAADLVVAGIGVTPRLDLAKAAGLTLDHGVLVDEYLRTSEPEIYAAGDIARWPDPHTGERIRVEHWVLAQRQGQAAARNMLGAREPFEAVPFFWSKHYKVSIRYAGHAEHWDRADVSGDAAAGDCSVAFRRGGKTLAVASLKRDLENLEAERALESGDEAALSRMVPHGPAGASA